MRFTIRNYKDGQFTDRAWTGTLTGAQDIFCQDVRDGIADGVEIRDANNELVFHYPLDMQREPKAFTDRFSGVL